MIFAPAISASRLVRFLARPLACAMAAGLMLTSAAAAQILEKEVPADARGLDVEEKPGAMLPLDTPLFRSDGKQVMLGDYFKSVDPAAASDLPSAKPTIIALVYYRCPVTCTAVMDKVVACMNKLEYSVGTEYNTLFISFDPDETPKQSREVKALHLAAYDRPETPAIKAGFEFFTGAANSVKSIADAVGFRYRRLQNGEYSHPVAIFVATPGGKVSRYFYGFDYPPRDMKLALLEAAEGKFTPSIGDRLLQFCYMYDPAKGRFTLQAMRVMQVGGTLSMIVVFSVIGLLLLAERARRRIAAKSPAAPQIIRVGASQESPNRPLDPPSGTRVSGKLA